MGQGGGTGPMPENIMKSDTTEETPCLEPLAERHYALPGSTKHLSGVLTEIPKETLRRMQRTIALRRHANRCIGAIQHNTQHYNFYGNHYIMRHGDAQIGRAATTDNMIGFGMIRLFANSGKEMEKLERECGRYEEPSETADQ